MIVNFEIELWLTWKLEVKKRSDKIQWEKKEKRKIQFKLFVFKNIYRFIDYRWAS